ncbi:lactonase family protein [Paenibacillus daejeonensis]|uniref:lactonase family protein n=1 Tax=Paenibacillus daejeonensis TaxID=135193 RepID=UPI00036317EF|nr:lactonase family protein [Paenibacillus daejeonensis]
MTMIPETKTLAVVGSYADAADPGLYLCEYDSDKGSLKIVQEVSGLQNPTFATIDGDKLTVYAISEETDEAGQRKGYASAFKLDPVALQLTLINKEETVPAPTCHIELDHSGSSVLVSSYHGGLLGLSPVLEDGALGLNADLHQHEGSSIRPAQSQARVHSVFVDRSNRWAIASDLGLDKVFVYQLDLENYRVIPHQEVSVTPGSGPRHFVFHPSLPYGYVIHELNGTISAFSFDEDQGKLEEVQTLSTLPEDFEGENGCADIHISPDGRFLYGSNRGHDSLAVFAIDEESGKLTLVEITSTLGGHPRNFAISPDGRFILVANRDGNHIVTFHRDEESGKLTPAGLELSVSKPVCIKFVSVMEAH